MPIVQPDELQFRPSSEAEGGASVPFARIFGEDAFDSGFRWLDLCIVKPGAEIGVHGHQIDDEVYAIIKGHGTKIVNDQEAQVGPGDTILLKCGGTHGLRNDLDEEIHVLVIDLLAPPEPNQRLLLRDWTEIPTVAKRSKGGTGQILVGDLFTADELGVAWDFVQCVKMPPGSAIGLHEHRGDEEIYYIVEGWGTMITDDGEVEVGPGTASLCKSGSRHGLVNNADSEMTILVAQAPLI
ncbi:MAG: cupin domain-containing protein [Anaerolineae bacterium]|jgi:mannose-6-phosphate isomerase-like protein (cupin superfamily)